MDTGIDESHVRYKILTMESLILAQDER
jgi:hypothetical protein